MAMVNIDAKTTINTDGILYVLDNPDESLPKSLKKIVETAEANGRYIDNTNSRGIKCLVLSRDGIVYGMSIRKTKFLEYAFDPKNIIRSGGKSSKQKQDK